MKQRTQLRVLAALLGTALLANPDVVRADAAAGATGVAAKAAGGTAAAAGTATADATATTDKTAGEPVAADGKDNAHILKEHHGETDEACKDIADDKYPLKKYDAPSKPIDDSSCIPKHCVRYDDKECTIESTNLKEDIVWARAIVEFHIADENVREH